MKYRRLSLQIVIVCVALLAWSEIKVVQADAFGNLGFEDGIASHLLPYWTCSGYLGNYAGYNDMALDSAFVSIHDSASGIIKPMVGNYSIFLQDGYGIYDPDDPFVLSSASISQVGDVPSWAKSLMFKSDISPWIDELQVSLNGTVIPFTLYSTDGTVNSKWGPVNTYILDVSAYVGQANVTLKFEKLVHDFTNPNDHGIVDLDAITFSTIIVPEPSSLILFVVGLLSFAVYFWRCRNRVT